MKPKMDFSKSSLSFQKAMQRTVRESSREWATVINFKAKDVAKRAIKHTPSADKNAIKASLEANKLVYKLINKSKLKEAAGIRTEEKRSKSKSGNVKTVTYHQLVKEKARKFIAARQRSANYIKAGWYRASQAFGLRGGKVRSGGLADKGTGTKATRGKLTAELVNRAYGSMEVGQKALDTAMESVRQDMMQRIAEKAQAAWRKAGKR